MDLPPLPEDIRATLPPVVAAYLTALETAVQTLSARVAELEARLGQNSSNSSRPPSSDPPGRRPAASPGTPSGRRPGGQPGHPGHCRALLPPEQVSAMVRRVPSQCAGCGAALPAVAAPTDPLDERQQVVEAPPTAAMVIEYHLAARRCGHCGHLTRAMLPATAGPSGFGPRLTAISTLLTGRYRLSKREAAACVGDVFGVDLAVGSVSALEQTMSAALAPMVAEAHAAVQQAPVANLDETRWRETRKRVWLWTVVTATLTVFQIAPSRGGKVARALVGAAWAGIIGSDRGTMYAWWDRERRQVCWAHLERDFQTLVDWGPGARPIGKRLLAIEAEVFACWHRFRRGEIDRAILMQEVAPHQAALRRALDDGAAGADAKAAGVCRELLKLWPALWTFVTVDGVEPTNNRAEQALRPAVLWRKGSFGTHSPTGSRFAERMLTVAATCRQQHRPLLDVLVRALVAARTGAPPPSLLPTPAE